MAKIVMTPQEVPIGLTGDEKALYIDPTTNHFTSVNAEGTVKDLETDSNDFDYFIDLLTKVRAAYPTIVLNDIVLDQENFTATVSVSLTKLFCEGLTSDLPDSFNPTSALNYKLPADLEYDIKVWCNATDSYKYEWNEIGDGFIQVTGKDTYTETIEFSEEEFTDYFIDHTFQYKASIVPNLGWPNLSVVIPGLNEQQIKEYNEFIMSIATETKTIKLG